MLTVANPHNSQCKEIRSTRTCAWRKPRVYTFNYIPLGQTLTACPPVVCPFFLFTSVDTSFRRYWASNYVLEVGRHCAIFSCFAKNPFCCACMLFSLSQEVSSAVHYLTFYIFAVWSIAGKYIFWSYRSFAVYKSL